METIAESYVKSFISTRGIYPVHFSIICSDSPKCLSHYLFSTLWKVLSYTTLILLSCTRSNDYKLVAAPSFLSLQRTGVRCTIFSDGPENRNVAGNLQGQYARFRNPVGSVGGVTMGSQIAAIS